VKGHPGKHSTRGIERGFDHETHAPLGSGKKRTERKLPATGKAKVELAFLTDRKGHARKDEGVNYNRG